MFAYDAQDLQVHGSIGLRLLLEMDSATCDPYGRVPLFAVIQDALLFRVLLDRQKSPACI